jgi:glycosyltransferase involved in cell wall biosynthesis
MISPGLPPAGGGIGAYTDKTSRALAGRGHEVHVLMPSTSAARTEVIDAVHLHHIPTPPIRPRGLARSWVVRRALARLGSFDIVQASEWGGEAWSYSLLRPENLVTRLATPHVITEEYERAGGTRPSGGIVTNWLERSQTRHSTRVISPSRVLADEVSRRWQLPPGSVTIVPTGIQTPRMNPADLPETLRGLNYVLYFGRLEQRKGVDTWIDALPLVLETYPSLHAVFVGEDVGMWGTSFADLARDRCGSQSNRLHFHPATSHEHLFATVASARLVVMPSRFESLANACLEAMALGRPVVATLGTGMAEIITDSLNGFLVSPGDAPSLAAKVAAALSDLARLAEVGKAAAVRAADYDLCRMVEYLTCVYQEIVASRSPGRSRATRRAM